MTSTANLPRLGIWPAICRALALHTPWLELRLWLYAQGWMTVDRKMLRLLFGTWKGEGE